jgi:anti-sigma factor RsiW
MPDLDRRVAGLRCRDVLADLSEFLDGNLAPERLASIQAHLAACDTCARFGGTVGTIVAALRAERDQPSPFDTTALSTLRDRVQLAIGAAGAPD